MTISWNQRGWWPWSILLLVLTSSSRRSWLARGTGLALFVATANLYAQTPPVTVDDSFNPGAHGTVSSLAVQADGKILVGGRFTTLGWQAGSSIGRLNADGTLDLGFNPGVGGFDQFVNSLTVQATGRFSWQAPLQG